jgi:hypothetical protein
MLLGHVDFPGYILFVEGGETALEALAKCVAHSDELYIRIGGQRLRRSAGSASSAPDKPYPQGFTGRPLSAWGGDTNGAADGNCA